MSEEMTMSEETMIDTPPEVETMSGLLGENVVFLGTHHVNLLEEAQWLRAVKLEGLDKEDWDDVLNEALSDAQLHGREFPNGDDCMGLQMLAESLLVHAGMNEPSIVAAVAIGDGAPWCLFLSAGEAFSEMHTKPGILWTWAQLVKDEVIVDGMDLDTWRAGLGVTVGGVA